MISQSALMKEDRMISGQLGRDKGRTEKSIMIGGWMVEERMTSNDLSTKHKLCGQISVRFFKKN
jgi:hypothetical protein